MKRSDQYLRLVYWSDEDQCYIGRSPGLFFGGVHGDNEVRVFKELVEVIDDWVETCEKEGMELPPPTANKAYSGKFNLRTGEELHERLVLESLKVSESLNTYVVKTLKKELGM
jgi:predicted HicB family RNase H-like nuclease